MSASSGIEEEIEEEVDEDIDFSSFAVDENTKQYGDTVEEFPNETETRQENGTKSPRATSPCLDEGDHNGADDRSLTSGRSEPVGETDKVKYENELNDHISNVLKTVDYIAIDTYSTNLANTLIDEALLINDVCERDKLKANVNDGDERSEVKTPEEGDQKSGCDSYLIEKFLHSKADPIDVTDDVGFDGKEEHFHSTYPGLDSNDNYVKGEQRQANTGNDTSDKNNNSKLQLNLVDPFAESLQTIHEDAELVIENGDEDAVDVEKGKVDTEDVDTCAKTAKDLQQNDQTQQEDTIGNKSELNVANTEDSGIDDSLSKDARDVTVAGSGSGDETREPTTGSGCGDAGTAETQANGEVQPGADEIILQFLEDDTIPEEIDCCEMTFKEKARMVVAVRAGSTDEVDAFLAKKNANIAMKWYGETLLMVAIRAGQHEMAEFLIDNGINWKFEAKVMELDANGTMSVHKMDARQMAYDRNMIKLIEILDNKSRNTFKFDKPKPRDFRLRQPIAPFIPPDLDEGFSQRYFITEEEIKEELKEETAKYWEQKRLQELKELNMRKNKGKGKNQKNEPTVEQDSNHTPRTSNSDLSNSNDELNEVFGPDEGYETMSPVSAFITQKNHESRVPNMKQHVSVRGTRASHLIRAHNATKMGMLRMMSESGKKGSNSAGEVDTIGSYNFEKRKWQAPRSAPQLRNYTDDNKQESKRGGLPFIHGGKERHTSAVSYSSKGSNTSVVSYSSKGSNKDANGKRPGILRSRTAMSVPERCTGSPDFPKVNKSMTSSTYRSKSAHGNVSPYSHVAKLLEQSRLFSPFIQSRSSTPQFPSVKFVDNSVTKTRLNYIYTDRASTASSRSSCRDIHSAKLKSDLLPKRKLLS